MITRRRVLGAMAGGAVTTGAAEPLEEIRLAVNALSFVTAGLRIGQLVGLFAHQGLEPRIQVMESGAAAMSALLGGSVAFTVNAPSETLAARARGQDVVILGNLYAGMAASLVLTKDVVAQRKVTPDAPLDARLRALDGVLVAVPSATSAPLGAIRAAVESVGARMRLTYMAQGAMMAAMERGAIEGMIAAFPFVGMPVLRGVGVTWIDGPAGDLPAEMRITSSATVQTTGAYLRSNRAIIGRFQRAIVAIAGYVTQEQAGARAALAALYPQMSEREIELAFAGQWRNLTKPFLTEADMRQELRLLIASTKAAGLEALDPAQALVGPI